MRIPSLLALFLGAACAGPPRIPFDEGTGWHASVHSGERWSNDRYIEEYNASGIEVYLPVPGTEGWGWELGASWGSGSGDASEKINVTRNNVTAVEAVDNHRESDIYELTIGVRQTYFPDSVVQPYFGVGGAVFKTKNVDHFDVAALLADPAVQPKPPEVEHFQTVDLALYLRTGLQWRILRDRIRKDSEMLVILDLRGSFGHEFSFVEVSLGVGYGR